MNVSQNQLKHPLVFTLDFVMITPYLRKTTLTVINPWKKKKYKKKCQIQTSI